MNCRTLEYALAVHETGSFRDAALRCKVTKATVSLQIRRLEACLGIVLFERGARRSRATADGEQVMPCIARAVECMQQLHICAARSSIEAAQASLTDCDLMSAQRDPATLMPHSV